MIRATRLASSPPAGFCTPEGVRRNALFDNHNRAKAWSGDNSTFAFVKEHKPNRFQVQVWDFRNLSQPRFTFDLGDTAGTHAALNQDGTLLATGSSSGMINVWDLSVSPPKTVQFLEYAGGAILTNMVFTPDGRKLVCARENGLVFCDWASSRVLRRFPLGGRVLDVVLNPDGRHLATVNGDGSIYILRLPELIGPGATQAQSAPAKAKTGRTISAATGSPAFGRPGL